MEQIYSKKLKLFLSDSVFSAGTANCIRKLHSQKNDALILCRQGEKSAICSSIKIWLSGGSFCTQVNIAKT